MKAGTVALIGRPNVGKSTLVNSIIGTKVSITSPKPQTTRFPVHGLLDEERGKVVFIDTPGIFRKAKDPVSKKVNARVMEPFEKEVDLVLYVVDPTRNRDFEEGRVIGIVRQLDIPKILVVNKVDLPQKFRPLYKFLEEEFDTIIEVSALTRVHLPTLVDAIFDRLPDEKDRVNPLPDTKDLTYPLLNMDAKTFLAELIREKVFLRTRHELPYTTTVVVDEVKTRESDTLYVRARILTTDDTYKKMLIGTNGRQIKELGMMARKEISLATGKKVFLELTVETDKHWVSTMM